MLGSLNSVCVLLKGCTQERLLVQPFLEIIISYGGCHIEDFLKPRRTCYIAGDTSFEREHRLLSNKIAVSSLQL